MSGIIFLFRCTASEVKAGSDEDLKLNEGTEALLKILILHFRLRILLQLSRIYLCTLTTAAPPGPLVSWSLGAGLTGRGRLKLYCFPASDTGKLPGAITDLGAEKLKVLAELGLGGLMVSLGADIWSLNKVLLFI